MDKGAKIEIAEERIEVSKAHCQLQSMVMSDIQNSRGIGERKDVGVGVVACLLACWAQKYTSIFVRYVPYFSSRNALLTLSPNSFLLREHVPASATAFLDLEAVLRGSLVTGGWSSLSEFSTSAGDDLRQW